MTLLSNVLYRLAQYVVIVGIGVMSLLVFIQVLSRDLFDYSFIWADEMGRFIFIWTVFFGASIALKDDQLVKVSFVFDFLPVKMQKAAKMGSIMLVLVFLGVVIVKGVDLVILTMAQKSASMRIPMGWAYAAVPAGSICMLVHLLAMSSHYVKEWMDQSPSRQKVT